MRARFSSDARSALLAAFFGAGAWALVDFGATLLAADGYQMSAGIVARLFLLELSLAAAFVFPLGALGIFALSAGLRALLSAHSRSAALSLSGVFGPPPSTREGPDPLPAWIWAIALVSAIYIAISAFATYQFHQLFQAPELVALLLAAAQLGLFAIHAALASLLGRALERLGAVMSRALQRAGGRPHHRAVRALLGVLRVNPLVSRGMALALATALAYLGLAYAERLVPGRQLLPWRMLITLVAFGAGAYAAGILRARRGGLFPRSAPRRTRVLGATAAAVATLSMATLFWLGAHPASKYVAVTSSPPVGALIKLGRVLTDVDRDGYGILLGEGPPQPRRDIAERPLNIGGSDLPIPEPYAQEDLNILLITIDTLRYDHTGFGGYKEERGRDTTPELDEIVSRSVNFEFAQAPSAGTMASIPAMLTSRFFHSGIALDEDVPRGMPPRVLDSNTLLAEVMKRGEYRTGAILTHHYFSDWGLEQGFDTYDNSLGPEPNPESITSPDVTDKAITWIREHMGTERWFLWAHYLDPHGHYMAHDMVDFGDSEEDRYDGEIRFADHHVGRLLDELERMPGADRTVVIITSDHGEGFGEHGYVNHGMDLNRELIHVPLIVYVPGLPPRRVKGPVSVLDIFPTMADIAQIDISDLALEGESLVPQLFYGEDAEDRVVFAETNWPDPLRALVTADYKLIYDLKNDFYELFDLEEDPWEKRNVADQRPEDLNELRNELDAWLERVYYDRDFESNQMMLHLEDTLLEEAPEPEHRVGDVTLEDGAIELLGFDISSPPHQPGDTLKLELFFAAKGEPKADYLFQAEGYVEGKARHAARSRLEITADGTFPTSRWRPGEFIRDEFEVRLPKSLESDRLTLVLRVDARDDAPIDLEGPHREGGDEEDTVILGEIPLAEAEEGR